MNTFLKLFILACVCACGVIIGGTIPHMPPPGQGVKVSPHIFNLSEPIITFGDRWEIDPQLTRLTGYGAWEGQLYDCIGKPLNYGDVAVPWDSDLRYNDEVLIYKDGIGFIEGRHLVRDICPTPHTADLYVPNRYLASKLTGKVTIYRRVR